MNGALGCTEHQTSRSRGYGAGGSTGDSWWDHLATPWGPSPGREPRDVRLWAVWPKGVRDEGTAHIKRPPEAKALVEPQSNRARLDAIGCNFWVRRLNKLTRPAQHAEGLHLATIRNDWRGKCGLDRAQGGGHFPGSPLLELADKKGVSFF